MPNVIQNNLIIQAAGVNLTGLLLGVGSSPVAAIAGTQGDILYRNASGWVVLGAGTSGWFLKTQGVGANPIWSTVATGDVVGPSSATDNALARFDTTTGKLIQNSLVTLSDAGAFSFVAGVKQTFAPNATNAGLNVGSQAGNPSSLANGDLYYDSTANQLKARINGSTVSLGTGTGDVVGPASATDNAIVRFDATTGKLIQNSVVTLSDAGVYLLGTQPTGGYLVAVNINGDSDGLTYYGSHRADASIFGGGLFAAKARGTIASPTATQSGDQLAIFAGGGYGTAWNEFAGLMGIFASQTWTGSANGIEYRWGVTPNGSITRAYAMVLGNDGALTVNTSVISPILAVAVGNEYITTVLGSGDMYYAARGRHLFYADTNNNDGSTAVEYEFHSGEAVGLTAKIRLSINNSGLVRFNNYGLGVIQSDASGNLTSSTLGATLGGTGQTVYAVGDLLYASTTTALSKLAAVAVGQVLVSAGTGTAPVWSPNLTLTGTIATSAPAGSSVQNWKLGNIQAGAVVADTTRSVFIDIAGTVYKLIVAV